MHLFLFLRAKVADKKSYIASTCWSAMIWLHTYYLALQCTSVQYGNTTESSSAIINRFVTNHFTSNISFLDSHPITALFPFYANNLSILTKWFACQTLLSEVTKSFHRLSISIGTRTKMAHSSLQNDYWIHQSMLGIYTILSVM